jgi:hypothetical protein
MLEAKRQGGRETRKHGRGDAGKQEGGEPAGLAFLEKL